jgi:hypothetical protein
MTILGDVTAMDRATGTPIARLDAEMVRLLRRPASILAGAGR